MKKSNLPSLPFGLELKMVHYVGKKIVIISEDEHCVYLFEWDGESPSFLMSNSFLKLELE